MPAESIALAGIGYRSTTAAPTCCFVHSCKRFGKLRGQQLQSYNLHTAVQENLEPCDGTQPMHSLVNQHHTQLRQMHLHEQGVKLAASYGSEQLLPTILPLTRSSILSLAEMPLCCCSRTPSRSSTSAAKPPGPRASRRKLLWEPALSRACQNRRWR